MNIYTHMTEVWFVTNNWWRWKWLELHCSRICL